MKRRMWPYRGERPPGDDTAHRRLGAPPRRGDGGKVRAMGEVGDVVLEVARESRVRGPRVQSLAQDPPTDVRRRSVTVIFSRGTPAVRSVVASTTTEHHCLIVALTTQRWSCAGLSDACGLDQMSLIH